MKILVIQQKMIGDVLTTSILFEALRKKFPHARLDYLIEPHTLPVVKHNPNIDRFVFSPESSFMGLLKLAKKIRKEHYQMVIDVYAKINSAFITRFSGAEKRISYHKWYTSPAYTRTVYPKKTPQTCSGLAIENRMLLFFPIPGSFPVELKPKIYLVPEERDAARKFLDTSGISREEPLYMISILGSSPIKTYPIDYMAKVLDFIVSQKNAQLIFNYNPKQERDARELLKLCAPHTRERIFFDVFGKGLREFLSLTSHCDALIGNEGGAVNMAKALDIPSFAIFSPQISKNAWFSNVDGNHMAVHLKDYKPENFRNKIKRYKKITALYHSFRPKYFLEELKLFLKEIK